MLRYCHSWSEGTSPALTSLMEQAEFDRKILNSIAKVTTNRTAERDIVRAGDETNLSDSPSQAPSADVSTGRGDSCASSLDHCPQAADHGTEGHWQASGLSGCQGGIRPSVSPESSPQEPSPVQVCQSGRRHAINTTQTQFVPCDSFSSFRNGKRMSQRHQGSDRASCTTSATPGVCDYRAPSPLLPHVCSEISPLDP